jgi:shikimate kinase
LGERIGWPWIDADEALEQRAGKTIKEIFQEGGEMAFRDWETTTVLELTRSDRTILALGGGAILREENRRAIRRGVVIWLQADPLTILQRTSADPLTAQRRPNLTAGGMAEIEELLAARTTLYHECADHSVETAGRTPDEVVEQIVCFLRTHFPTEVLR